MNALRNSFPKLAAILFGLLPFLNASCKTNQTPELELDPAQLKESLDLTRDHNKRLQKTLDQETEQLEGELHLAEKRNKHLRNALRSSHLEELKRLKKKYSDAKGFRVGNWVTIHSDNPSKNEHFGELLVILSRKVANKPLYVLGQKAVVVGDDSVKVEGYKIAWSEGPLAKTQQLVGSLPYSTGAVLTVHSDGSFDVKGGESGAGVEATVVGFESPDYH